MSEHKSPIVMERIQRPVEGDPEQDLFDMVEITLASTGEVLATCMMSDDLGLERIADLLSAKRLTNEANRFRAMISASRRPQCQPKAAVSQDPEE